MRLRTTYPGFTAAVDSYFDHLIKKVAPYQVLLMLVRPERKVKNH